MTAPSYTPQLRPLGVGETLDAGFRLFRQRFGTLILCVLVPLLPLTILGTAVQASIDENAFDLDATSSATTDSGTAFAALGVSTVLQMLGAALAIAACFKAISAAYLGERAGAGESLRYGLGRLLPLVIAYIVVILILIPAFIALIIPGIWIGVKLSMTFPVVVFERAGPFRAIGRSWSLTKGGWWRTFGTLVVLILISWVLQLVLGGVAGAVLGAGDSSELAAAIGLTLVNLFVLAVTYPLWAAIVSVIYYDLRVRHEGFDLQLLAQGVGGDASRFEAAPERPSVPPPSTGPSDGGGGFAPPGEERPTPS